MVGTRGWSWVQTWSTTACPWESCSRTPYCGKSLKLFSALRALVQLHTAGCCIWLTICLTKVLPLTHPRKSEAECHKQKGISELAAFIEGAKEGWGPSLNYFYRGIREKILWNWFRNTVPEFWLKSVGKSLHFEFRGKCH